MGEKAFIMVGPQGSLHGTRGPAQGDRGPGLLSGARQGQAQVGLQGQGPVHLPGRLQAVLGRQAWASMSAQCCRG